MEKVKCVVCGEEYHHNDYLFQGYVNGEPICRPCSEDLNTHLDLGIEPSIATEEN